MSTFRDGIPSTPEIARRTLLSALAASGLGSVIGFTSGPARQGRPLAVGLVASAAAARPLPGGSLDPLTIPKYRTELPRIPVMPPIGTTTFEDGPVDLYSIAARQFRQQILPRSFPRTTVWGYGIPGLRGSFSSPGHTIEARVGRPVRVTWTNGLVDRRGRWLPHLLTVDPTLHWANPGGGISGRDSRPSFTSTPGPYTGPVPLVSHLHGAHVTEESDGYPEAWTLPRAVNIPAGYAATGTYYSRYSEAAAACFGVRWRPGSSTYQYPNDQQAAALWYHDHALGITRLNVQAGLAGLYLLRGGAADLPPGVLPCGRAEIGLAIQDRSFNSDGSLFFPTSRAFFGDTPANGPWVPTTDVPPYWNPESFGNTMVVNGVTWPLWHGARTRYRLRVLNACNGRTLILKVVADPLAKRPVTAALPIWQIGSDGGFLPRAVQLDQVLIAPGERADLILDLSSVPVGTALYLINEGPDSAYRGGVPGTGFAPSDPRTSGQIMKIVVSRTAADTTVPPARLQLPAVTPLGAAEERFAISLNESTSTHFPGAVVATRLGTLNADGTARPEMWSDPVSVRPTAGAVGEWDLVNFTMDAHPIHLHQTQAQVVSRTAADGSARGPEAWEAGFKDTVIAYPGETTRLKARFDLPGRYVYHCHILDHEDHDMMRPLQVES